MKSSTNPSFTAVAMVQNRSRTTKAPPLTSKIADMVLSRSNHSCTLSRTNPPELPNIK